MGAATRAITAHSAATHRGRGGLSRPFRLHFHAGSTCFVKTDRDGLLFRTHAMLTAAHVPDFRTYKPTGLCRRRLASPSGFPRTLNCSLFGHDQITSCQDEAVRLPKGALRGHL